MPTQNARFQLRAGASTLWASVNPTLASAEPGWETDTGLLRIGDGVTPFTGLPYLFSSVSHPALATFDPSLYLSVVAATYTGNLDSLTTSTIRRLGVGATNAWAGFSVGDFVVNLVTDASNAIQIGYDASEGGRARYRAKVAGTWSAWSVGMTLEGAQTITGDKTFHGTQTFATLLATTLGQAAANITLAGGFVANNDADGTFSSGTYTPTPVGGNFKSITNNGAFTLAAPGVAGHYSMVIEVTNGASAGAITLSGFARTAGDVFTTTNGHRFQIFIAKTLNGVTATVLAMQ